MRTWPRSVLSALIAGVVFAGGARELSGAQLTNLYRVEVVVDPEVEDPRQEAFERAMGEQLVRLTGRRDAAADPLLLEIITAAQRFVQRWGYADPETLAITFDGRALETELANRDQPVWGKDRPLTLVWIALDAGGGSRRLLNGREEPLPDEPDGELAAALLAEVTSAAQRRGVPLAFPLLDSEDLALVTFADVWGGFTSRVEAASRRYQPDGILVGRVRAAGGAMSARWQYLGPGERRERRSGVTEGLEWLADIYANQYAVTGGSSVARLVVTEVSSFDDYARLLAHLEGLSIIDAVNVEELSGEELVIGLTTRAKAEVLDRALTLGGIITPAAAPFADPMAISLDRASARYFRMLR